MEETPILPEPVRAAAADSAGVTSGRPDRHMTAPRPYGDPGAPVAAITIPAGRCDDATAARIREVLLAHPGPVEVHLHLTSGGKRTTVRLSPAFSVTPSAGLAAELGQITGTLTEPETRE
jgi:hypothetical protein